MFSYEDRLKLREKYKNIDSDSYPYDFIDFNMFNKNSLPEIQIWNEIRSRGMKMFPEFPIGKYFVDFGNPFCKVALEVDGKEFHQDKEKDAIRQKEIESMGWKVYRISAEDILGSSEQEKEVQIMLEEGLDPKNDLGFSYHWLQFNDFMDQLKEVGDSRNIESSDDPEKYKVTLDFIKSTIEKRGDHDEVYDYTVGSFVKRK